MSKLFQNTFWEKVCFVRREFLAAFCLAVAVSIFSGCLNVRMHANGRVHRAYTGTEMNVEAMELSWKHEGYLLLLPLAIDLPLEVVADTLTLPFDL